MRRTASCRTASRRRSSRSSTTTTPPARRSIARWPSRAAADVRQRPGEARRRGPSRGHRPRPRAGEARSPSRSWKACLGAALRWLPRDRPAWGKRDRPVGGPPGQGRRAVDAQGGVRPRRARDHALHRLSSRARFEASSDVLMPGIAACRTCHRGEHAATALPSTCIMCHVYHRDGCPRCCLVPPRPRSRRNRAQSGQSARVASVLFCPQ